jgi:ABC-type phosphate transport system substrate-binding protein
MAEHALLHKLWSNSMFARLKLFATALAILVSTSAYADLAIIVNPSYHDGKLDIQDIKKLFLGERTAFPDGNYAMPVNHNDGSPDRKQFYSSVLGMNATSLSRYWRRQIGMGNNNQPTVANSYTAVLKTVASTPNSISYINSNMVNNKVKVLMVLDNNGIVKN